MHQDQILQPTPMDRKKQILLFQQKKKYRNIQHDKKSYVDQSVKIIKKQKTTLQKIKKQNQTLKDLISKINKQKNIPIIKSIPDTQSQTQQLKQLLLAIQNQHQTQKTIDIHITNFQKKITQKRKNYLGINSGLENQNNLQKQIKILQNRLDKANQKFNQTTANNRQLKNLIDSFRRQRVIFDNLYKKLEKQLHQRRKKMADIIERANNAYEQRDKAHNQIQTLKVQAKKQASQFEKQIKQMSYLMEKIKLSSYSKKRTIQQKSTPPNFHLTQQLMTSTQPRLFKPTKKNSQQIQKIQKYRQDFTKIQAATDIQNFDQLLRIFSENQQKNFQMFKFVNLQSNQIQQLESQLFQLTTQLKSSQSPQSQLLQKDTYVIQLQKNLQNLKLQLQNLQIQYQKNQSSIRPLITHIQRIFQTIQCDRQLVKQLSSNKTISQNNLYIFLAIIQHKSIQIINTFKQLANPGLFNTSIKPNNIQTGILTFDDFQDNQQYNKILTAQQLRQKAKDFIEKQQNQKLKKKQLRNKKK